jgi:hypothetical protein
MTCACSERGIGGRTWSRFSERASSPTMTTSRGGACVPRIEKRASTASRSSVRSAFVARHSAPSAVAATPATSSRMARRR